MNLYSATHLQDLKFNITISFYIEILLPKFFIRSDIAIKILLVMQSNIEAVI